MSRSRYKFIPGDTSPYLLTATTVNWLPLFNNPTIAEIIFDSLRFLQAHNRLTIYAYVLMENHLHLIASAEILEKEIANFKSFTARKSIDHYLSGENSFILEQLAFHKIPHRIDRDYQFWQQGVHPQQIQSTAMLHQKIEYMHHNPVRRGYVELPEHWRYSSARNYAGMEGLLDVCKDW